MASITEYKGGYRAFVTVNGKRKTKTFAKKREAQEWVAHTEVGMRKEADKPEASRHTVRDMLKQYSRDVSSKKEGARSEQMRITAFLRNFPALSDKTLATVRTPDIAAWRDARLAGFTLEDGTRVAPVSAASVLRDLNWLRNAFTIARQEWHWLEHNPFTGLRMPQEPPPRERRISPFSEVRPLVRHLGYRTGVAPETKSQEVALAFLIALRSAMRAGEILSLGAANVDLAKRVVTVEHKMQYLTGRMRSIPLTRHAARLLRPVANREKCFTVSSASLDTLFRKARDQLAVGRPALREIHFHDSRAEALTRLSRKVDVMTLAKISGHKDLSILQNTYYRETAEDIAARI
ncbi:tyrosine-type recombinase/integrase [Caballeronia sp. AZ7_KS35]|uniref:tyrosine-type recombinase/integrase n=1 Tax=Caballeronia sp. AZ7_KS35 TaxID=2921762 RepID=UPI00202851F8|nr:tyrosine-type recombinase/integrase [Caballeronia sp. AZ7_KS35]